jgi:hypothetical protein
MEKKIPIGVIIISILYFLFAILLFFLGFMLYRIGLSNSIINNLYKAPFLLNFFGSLFGLILIIFGFVYILVGLGLLFRNKSARVGAVLLSVIILIMIMGGNILNTITGLIISGAIIYYLTLNKKVQQFFS